MQKNYSFFNLLSLTVIVILLFFLVAFFGDSDDIVEFTDIGLETSVRESIDKEEGEIYYEDIQELQVLDASNRNIKSLDGIEALIELQELNLENNFVENVSPLKNLMKLQDLNLRNNEITSLEDINFQDVIKLNIRRLSLRHNVKRDEDGDGTRLEDISLLGNMVSLRKLELRDNHIKDLSPISNLRKLTKLDIRENKFDNIKPLQTLNKLEDLNIRDNKVDSLEPLEYLTRLKYLNIHSNKRVESLDPLKDLINLETLIMKNVEIDNISFLKKFTKLQRINAIDTGIENLDNDVIETLLKKGALAGDVRPARMLNTLDAPEFSKDTGFYEKEFVLNLSSEYNDTEIYYTLDGSEPTINSNIYDNPIDIKEIDIDTATIVRAKILTDENTLSETITKSYFTHKDINHRFDLPVFSLVTDPENLFDEEKGIYTELNSKKKGTEWERPVHVDYFNENGELKLRQNAGVRIHGGQSRRKASKSLRLYANSEYDVKDNFENVFFENLEKKNSKESISTLKNVILRNSGQDHYKTMFADAFNQELAKPIGTFETQAYEPAVIFINGEYYGIQNIRERFDEYYFENHYNIEKNDVAILENDSSLYKGSTKDVFHYNNMIKYIEENDIKEDKNLTYVETQMDFESFIDYFATEIYYGNMDWPRNNIKFWRKTTDNYIKDAPYGHDGRWRWMMFDTDFGFHLSDNVWRDTYNSEPVKNNSIQWIMEEFDIYTEKSWSNNLFRKLMSNETFQNNFFIRINDLINSYLNEYSALDKLDEIASDIEEEIVHHIDRWDTMTSNEEWYTEINNKKEFAKERPYYMRKFIMEEFDIENTISINVKNETAEGYVHLNTIDITLDLPGNVGNEVWTGTYFKDIPISVKAIAKNGYTFSHWEGINSNQSNLEINPSNDLTLIPIFIKE